MIDVEPLIREELELRVPLADPEVASWPDILRRSGETQRRRRRRVTATIVTGAAVAALGISPLGGAMTRAVGGFSDWLTGTPGTSPSPAAQRQFKNTSPFPGNPRLRELLHVTLDGRRFVLYGFATRHVVCLRVAVSALAGAGPQAACVSRADLRRSHDLVLPVKANLSFGHLGRLPGHGHKLPTLPKYVLTFGVAARDVVSVGVQTDRGTSRAAVRNGAFLHVFRPRRRGVWARAVIARSATRRANVVPLSVEVSGQLLRTGLRPHGPSRVTRTVTGGTIAWFVHREARGLSPEQAHVNIRGCCHGYIRVIQPDSADFLLMLISDHSPVPIPPSARRRLSMPKPKPGEHRICLGAYTHGSLGSGCTTVEKLFREGPLALSWGFSGGGQQLWVVEGLASDDVTRIEVFLATGQHWRAPLRDNATVFRVQRAKFPARIVAYDAFGHVIAIRTIRGG